MIDRTNLEARIKYLEQRFAEVERQLELTQIEIDQLKEGLTTNESTSSKT